MNANELADELDNMLNAIGLTDNRVPTMLRQQQVLIENLNGRIERMIEKQSHYESMAHAGGFEAGRELGMKQERERNNEPIAWMRLTGNRVTRITLEKVRYDDIPLYTHPVKELTDEEIIKVYEDMLGVASAKGSAIDFARAILRKAQEK